MRSMTLQSLWWCAAVLAVLVSPTLATQLPQAKDIAHLPVEAQAWLSELSKSPYAANNTCSFLRQELAHVGAQTWAKRLAMHRSLDTVHDATASHALVETDQLFDALRASLQNDAAPTAGPEGVCQSGDVGCAMAEPDIGNLPGPARVWLSSLAASGSVSLSLHELVDREMRKIEDKSWGKKKAKRRALAALYETMISHKLSEVAQMVKALRDALDVEDGDDEDGDRTKRRRQRKYLVRESAVGLAWDDEAASTSGRVGGLEDDSCEFVEPGVDYPVPAFEMFRRVESWRDCCALCRRDPGCVYWTWAASSWRIESQRECCWLKTAAAKPLRAQVVPMKDASIFSGSVPTARVQTSTSAACTKLPSDLKRNRLARDILHQILHTGRNWSSSTLTPSAPPATAVTALVDGIPRHVFFIHYYDALTNPLYLCAVESFLARNPGHRVIVYAKNATDFERKLAHHFRNSASAIDRSAASGSAHAHATNEQTENANALRIVVRKIKFDEAFKNTPLQEWYASGRWKGATRPVLDLCDAMRLALLYSIGGTHAHTRTHAHTHTHTHTHAHIYIHAHTHSQTHTLSLTHTQVPI